jgi:hypothetical protein
MTGALRLAVVAWLGCAAWGCGDDDDDHARQDAGPSHDSGTGVDASTDAGALHDAGGDAQLGTGEEGQPCRTVADCGLQLRCVSSPLVDQNGAAVGICGRACGDVNDCDDMEQCFSYTQLPRDLHCVKAVTDEFGACGPTITSVCGEPLLCLIPQNGSVGSCVKACSLSANGETDGGAEDGGAAQEGGDAAECSAGEMCLDRLLGAPRDVGVCGKVVARGQDCGSSHGLYCADADDFCGPEHPDDRNSNLRCFQDCTNHQKCDEGVCTSVNGLFAICI